MNGGSIRVEHAHAKINLLLRILAREASGYHGLETLFQTLELHDVVSVSVHDGPRTLTCAGPTMPAGGLGAPEDNLAWRAAARYAEAARWDPGWTIAIEKRIPVGGGLGGGSADAAAVLRALDAVAPAPLGMARLLELAGELGADVPFLTHGASRAWAWGRGDRLQILPPLPSVPVHLVTFADGVATAAAYAAVAASREGAGPHAMPAVAYAADALSSWTAIASLAANEFEPVVAPLHTGVAEVLPVLRNTAERLRMAGLPAIGLMSGSGATCYLLGAPADQPPSLRTTSATVVTTATRARP